MKKLILVSAGFIAGIIYVAACNVAVTPSQADTASPSVSATVVHAVDVVFDNAASALVATNVQAALDEIVRKAREFEAKFDLTTGILGTWHLARTYDASGTSSGAITFNADGTYSADPGSDNNLKFCSSGRYALALGMLILERTCGEGPNNFTIALSGTNLYLGKDSNHAYVGTKS